MTLRAAVEKIALYDRLNFLLTNRIPRRLFTLALAWFSKQENPWIRDASIGVWRYFSGLDLSDAKKLEFKSMHDCFIRELKPDARPIAADPQVIVSPCDAIVGACGSLSGVTALQAKGFPYSLQELLQEPQLVELYRDGIFATLRLTAAMYHRFHAPHDCTVRRVTYIAGDTWNVNPSALKRVDKLFCRNERAVIPCELSHAGITLTLVPVAAILVASIRLHCADVLLHLRYRGANLIRCAAQIAKGEEMGWFQHGSTIIVFAPGSLALDPSVRPGARIQVGRPLFRLPG